MSPTISDSTSKRFERQTFERLLMEMPDRKKAEAIDKLFFTAPPPMKYLPYYEPSLAIVVGLVVLK